MAIWEECVKSATIGDLAVRMRPGPKMTFWHVLGNGSVQTALCYSMTSEHLALDIAASQMPPPSHPELLKRNMLATERTAAMICALRDAVAVPALWEAQKR
jgi:hypothetical protein